MQNIYVKSEQNHRIALNERENTPKITTYKSRPVSNHNKINKARPSQPRKIKLDTSNQSKILSGKSYTKSPYNYQRFEEKNLYSTMPNKFSSRNVYSQQEIKPKKTQEMPGIDMNMLKQLQALQMQLLNNPNIIEKTQQILDNSNIHENNSNNSHLKTQTHYINTIGELETELGQIRIENEKNKQLINDFEFEIGNKNQQLDIENKKVLNLMKELNDCQELRDRLDESIFEIQKLENERDFHHKNHVDLRKELYQKTNNEFQLNQLKRDLHYKNEEFGSLKERCVALEKQIDELLVFAEKPRNEKQTTTETFYAKKIVDLERVIKNLKEEKFELENFYGNKIERSQRDSNTTQEKNKDFGRNHLEMETFKMKLETSKRENTLLKKQLDQARSNALNNSRTSRNDSTNNLKYQAMIKRYMKQIEELRQENRILNEKKNTFQNPNPNQNNSFEIKKKIEMQQKRINILMEEKMDLERKIENLNNELKRKDKMLIESKKNGNSGENEKMRRLMEANMRMTEEINRLQEQFRKMESQNRSSLGLDEIDKNEHMDKFLRGI